MTKNLFLSICLLSLLCTACATYNAATSEAREDAHELKRAYQAQSKITYAVKPALETQDTKAAVDVDAADDPAIWVNPENARQSIVYGTNKTNGLAAYDLTGKEVAYYPLGRVNNMDVLYDFPMRGTKVSLVGCTNRSTQGIDLMRIQSDGSLTDIAAQPMLTDRSLIDDIYGFCFATDRKMQKHYAILNGKNGRMQQYELVTNGDKIDWKLVREVQFASQTEGMVADDKWGFLYVGEEGKGVWKLSIDPTSSHQKLLANSGANNRNIRYDVEGLTLYSEADGSGYLLVSSQGNFSYAVFEREADNRYVGSFKITGAHSIDGVEETDGLDAVSTYLNADFPKGMLVVQDGFNSNVSGESLPQNFKYIDWRDVQAILRQMQQ